jgi:hypothetical protein
MDMGIDKKRDTYRKLWDIGERSSNKPTGTIAQVSLQPIGKGADKRRQRHKGSQRQSKD